MTYMYQQMTGNPDNYPNVYRHLMTVGLLGAVYRAREDSQIVSDAVELTMNDPRQFRMYRAVAQGIGGDAEYAISTLGAYLEKNPDDEIAKVAIAMSKMLAGHDDWKQLIDNVLATSSDQLVRTAASGIVAYLEQLNRQ